MSRLLQFFAAVVASLCLLLISSGWAQDRSDEASYYRYEVWGTGTQEPKRERPWSESYDTEAQAESRLEEIERDHAKGGLLETAPDHPLNLKVKKIPYKRSAKTDERTEKSKPEVPALSGPKGAIPKVASKGTITVRVYKLVDNKWVDQPDRKFESSNQQDYDKAVDYFQKVKATQGWIATWNAPGWPKPNEAEAKSYIPPVIGSREAKELRPYGATLKSEPKPQAVKPPTSDLNLSGTYWRRRDRMEISNYSALTFNADNTVTISVYPDGRRQGTWSTRGQEVFVKDPDGDIFSGTVRGDNMYINFGRGNRQLIRER